MNPDAPNLFILGVAKSGTTTLADSLRQHPDIFITPTKEPTFFSSDMNYARGMAWYLNTFFPATSGFRYRGEASPSYIYFADKVARRLKDDLQGQDLKFIVIFRNPIDRAYSHYWHNVNRSRQETLSFERALQAEDARLRQAGAELQALGRIRYAYFSAGLYAAQLRTFWQYFPRHDFLLLLYEDLAAPEFQDTLQRVHAFLGLPRLEVRYAHSNPSYRPRSRRLDRAVRGRSWIKDLVKHTVPVLERGRLKMALLRMNAGQATYPAMDPATREMLGRRYAASIKDFEELVGRDLSAWLD